MSGIKLTTVESSKTVEETVQEIVEKAEKEGFIPRYTFNMGEEFKKHGVDVDDEFQFYSIMLCNPQKAYNSIRKNPVRGAVLLPPKQVTVYKDKDDKTMISYLGFDLETVRKIVPGDEEFSKGLSQSCEKINGIVQSTM